ncbi:hypothetical protein PVAG01_02752 [Phlyctema vagabunda]|uniref:SNF2 N-terminal domain-containing protein n=1 Tax=Phlyctema vagabunda TaxID=108571 RepID=A0ABR4PSS4_9HELO
MSLTPYQITGIDRILQFVKDSRLNGYIVADQTGLRKPFQYISIIQAIANKRRQKQIAYRIARAEVDSVIDRYIEIDEENARSIADRQEPLPSDLDAILSEPVLDMALAKPTLVVVPPHLVRQWVDEIKRINKDFAVHLYHGDTREHSDSYRYISGYLETDNELFDGNELRPKTLVITSIRT